MLRQESTDCELGPFITKELTLCIVYASVHLACLIPPLLNCLTNQSYSILNSTLSVLVMLSHLSNIVFAIIGTFIAFGDIEYPEEDDQLIGTVHLFIILRLIF